MESLFQLVAPLKFTWLLIQVKSLINAIFLESLFLAINKFKVHMVTHTGGKPQQHSTCAKYFGTMGTLNTHLLTHTGEKPYPCEVCGKTFSTNNKSKVHMGTHTGKKPHQCSIYDK